MSFPSSLPKYHRELYHGDYFSVHKDIIGHYWVFSNKFSDLVYCGPFVSLSDVMHFVFDVNTSMRYLTLKGVVYYE